MLDQIADQRDGEIVVDYFAGAGGASHGLHQAGWQVDVAINHDVEAILMHSVNHPTTIHLTDDVWNVDPHRDLPPGPLALAWFSPSCTHFSRAKGGATLDNQTRALPWVAVALAKARRPRVVALENVPEMVTWGPLDDDGKPLPGTKGDTFRQFVWRLETLGYKVEWRVLHAHHFGAPTSRKRLFLIARCDGGEIVWPEATHGPELAPYRTAAECIDWSEPCPSIFERAKPLAEKTQARIAEGIRRYVLNGSPFVVNLTHGGRVEPVDEPMRTITAAHRGEKALVMPTMIQTGYGEREGQRPRALDIRAPLGTVVAGGAKHALVCAWIVKHYGGVYGHGVERPLGTITTQDHHSLAVVTTHGDHADDVARLMGTSSPVHVTVDGADHVIADIGMRMLTPRELARAQGFPDSYVLTGTKASQIARIGNAVVPAMSKVLAEANAKRPPGWHPPKKGRR